MKWLKEKLLVLAVIVVLFQLGNYVDTAATGITIEKTIEKPITDQQELVRRPRFARPIFAIFHTLGNIKRIFQDQYNETTNAFRRVLSILREGFSDTAQPKPITLNVNDGNNMTSTTTEKYRISRKEFGYILGRNYRGLQKLFRLELNDALNQSKQSIVEYKNEFGQAVAPYTVKKSFTTVKTTTEGTK